MKNSNKNRLFEVLGKVDKDFKLKINEDIDHINDVPLDINDPDKLEKDLVYDEFRNGAYHYGAVDTYNSTPELNQMFQEMETGKIPLKKEYIYLKHRKNGAVLLAIRLYQNGWAVVNSVSQRQKFPVIIDLPRNYGIYSQFVFPPDKVTGAFDFVRLEKDEVMKKGFNLYEDQDDISEQVLDEDYIKGWSFRTTNVELDIYGLKEKFHPDAEYIDTYRQTATVAWSIDPDVRDWGIKDMSITVQSIGGSIEYEITYPDERQEETKTIELENFKWDIEVDVNDRKFGDLISPSNVELNFQNMKCIISF